ncbi:hypothetical protein ACTFIW_011161 [Dictyostelium discoideum]
MRFLKLVDWVFINYHYELEKGGKLYYNDDRYYHFLFATDRYELDNNNNNNNKNNNNNNNNNNNTITYNNNINYYYDIENDIYLERLSKLIGYINEFTPFLFEVNNFKFLNWFLTKIKNIHFSSKKTSTHKVALRQVVSYFMSCIITYNMGLKVLEYIHQYYDFILKKELDGGILPPRELERCLISTIHQSLIKTTEILFQFIPMTKKTFETVSNGKLQQHFLNKPKTI